MSNEDLFSAVRYGDLDRTKELIENGADVDYFDCTYFHSLLHMAAQNNDTDICELLLSEGADVNPDDKCGYRPLHFAAEGGHLEVAKLLCTRGAIVNAQTDDGLTPLQAAIASHNSDLVECLVDEGADLEFTNGETALHTAVSEGTYHTVRFFITDVGLSPGSKSFEGTTPCAIAIKDQRKDLTELLYNAGYDPSPEELCLTDDDEQDEQDEEWRNFIVFMKQEVSKPRTLQQLCSLKIKQVFGHQEERLDDLLPQTLIDFVLLKHI